MCESVSRLIAWLDGELAADEAAQIERHVSACAECRNCVAEFRRVSGTFAQYCEAVSAAQEASAARRWAPALCGVAAVAAGFIVLVLAVPRSRVAAPAVAVTTASPVATNAEAPNSPVAATHSAAARNTRHRTEHGGRGVVTAAPPAIWPAADAAIQIAIPAEAMFPPGAMPDGVNFVADVSLGADGAVEQLRLRPRLVRFEKGEN